MSLMNILMEAQQGQSTDVLARQFGLDSSQTKNALSALVPALTAGVKRNTAQEGGLASLMGALAGGSHDQYLDNPAKVASSQAVEEGNGILGHVLGSKDVSRQLAARASAKTGISDDVLKKMLPVVASMVMGALSKQAGGGRAYEGEADSGSLGSLVGGVMDSITGGGSKSGGSKAADLLTSALDRDGDGSMLDDVIGGFFKR
ncbi:hypothetical protein BN1012_Phect2538 [Candidatus Phaeomarinobacter ectocarpi]|uniref:DUF937 domain-containing protein n=1 Tax=Candidatus Phaeomarinibacter ectocarpi TaxID=1458461 RepID=X5MP15_9HYPH|nr:DUF937 domain-containing protein [Candidatus Phaeomarinobacter ectocarpi]CDO60751.1 hypothetical protein BN1012_Phect2538 [Candidatus Phaeomarinobacter ectocarpi]